jgi:formylglycine-generating enzyme required for sulfatase activity
MKTTFSKSLQLLCNFSVVLWLVVLRTVADEVRFFRIVGPTATTITAVTPDGYITWTNAQIGATYTAQTARSLGAATNWVDYIQIPVSNNVVTHRLYDPNPPSGMVLLPAGNFTMGNCMDPGEGDSSELPLHTVNVSGFYMDTNLVTYKLWTNVYQWATNNGYSFDNAGLGKAASHPVQTLSWYDCVKWCNARSEKEGRVPCYYTNASQSQATIYRSGRFDLATNWVNWVVSGYRLPTEAEWEKAARGGVSEHRFPWSDSDTINWSRANYYAYPLSAGGYAYDVNATSGYNPAWTSGGYPYTTAVGTFAANGYGLYDMAGNVLQRCWDWYDAYYSSSPGTDPRGPASSSYGSRVLRGGAWSGPAIRTRCAGRLFNEPLIANLNYGFRCVRGL